MERRQSGAQDCGVHDACGCCVCGCCVCFVSGSDVWGAWGTSNGRVSSAPEEGSVQATLPAPLQGAAAGDACRRVKRPHSGERVDASAFSTPKGRFLGHAAKQTLFQTTMPRCLARLLSRPPPPGCHFQRCRCRCIDGRDVGCSARPAQQVCRAAACAWLRAGLPAAAQ